MTPNRAGGPLATTVRSKLPPERRKRERLGLGPHLAQSEVLGMTEGQEVAVLDPDVEREKPVRRGQVERPPEVPIQRGQHHPQDAERQGQRQHRDHRKRAATGQRSGRAVEVASHGQVSQLATAAARCCGATAGGPAMMVVHQFPARHHSLSRCGARAVSTPAGIRRLGDRS